MTVFADSFEVLERNGWKDGTRKLDRLRNRRRSTRISDLKLGDKGVEDMHRQQWIKEGKLAVN